MKYKTGCRRLDWRIPFNRCSVPDEDLICRILAVVEEIPEGRVATYRRIARLIGKERNARLVGKVLSMAEYYGKYPCHRVGKLQRSDRTVLCGAKSPARSRKYCHER